MIIAEFEIIFYVFSTMRKDFLLIFPLFLMLLVQLNAQEGVITDETLTKLLYKKELRSSIKPGIPLSLIPEFPFKDRIREEIETLNPTIGVEMLILYKNSMDELLSVYNILRSISTLKGVTYYSASRKRMRILFNDSYVVDSPEKKNRIEDPLVNVIPEKSEIHIFMKFSSLGKNIYKVEYLFQGDHIIMKIENLTTMKFSIIPLIPVVKPHHFINYFIVFPGKNNSFIYGLACTRFRTFLGIGKSKEESLYNLLKALYNWFIESLNKD